MLRTFDNTLIAHMYDPFSTQLNTQLTVKSNRRMKCILEAVALEELVGLRQRSVLHFVLDLE